MEGGGEEEFFFIVNNYSHKYILIRLLFYVKYQVCCVLFCITIYYADHISRLYHISSQNDFHLLQVGFYFQFIAL